MTQTPLFSLGDLILDTTTLNGNDRDCGSLIEGSITGRFISVLTRMYATMATRRHTPITNYMIRKCVGGTFVKKRNTHAAQVKLKFVSRVRGVGPADTKTCHWRHLVSSSYL